MIGKLRDAGINVGKCFFLSFFLLKKRPPSAIFLQEICGDGDCSVNHRAYKWWHVLAVEEGRLKERQLHLTDAFATTILCRIFNSPNELLAWKVCHSLSALQAESGSRGLSVPQLC